MPNLPASRLIVLSLVAGWVAAFAAGTHAFMSWESRPGRHPGTAKSAAPAPTWRLLMVAHPLCPCTEASLEALRALASEPRLRATVRFVGREETRSVRAARTIPGLAVEQVSGLDDVRDFGAATSGQTFLFDPHGRVRYSGGLTEGRGSFATSRGVKAIRSLLEGRASTAALPVYGCALSQEEASR